MTNLIELQNTSKNFGEKIAVDNISFTVKKGEILGLLGTNGAGKSTTMRMIAGYLSPDSGSVTIGEKNILADPVFCKSLIGYLPEGAPLYGELSARILLNFVAKARNIAKSQLEQRLKFVINNLHLEPVLDKAIETLSKGFKRRVAFAMAILHDPQILILDEPTDGLDPVQKHEVRQLIKNLSPNKAIIISTHILEEVAALCDRVIIINNGKIIANTTVQELTAKNPKQNLDEIFRNYVEANNNYY